MVSPLALSPLLLAGAGVVAERVARVRAANRYPVPGDLQNVGGHRIHYQIYGAHHLERDAAAPVVLLEADTADWSSHWGSLPSELGQTCTVIAYDRAGLGWSGPGPNPRDADSLAKELHQLLIQIAPRRRALLVGHGLGTWIARMYAHRYPFETAGLVLLDGEHEGFADLARRKGLPSNDASRLFLRLLMLANGLGLCRAFGMALTVPQVPDSGLSDRTKLAMIQRGFAPATLRTILAEQDAKAASREQVAALKDHFEFPVRILAAGRSTLPE
ncbi:MAG TPA: alpha/beta fold hydrolase, partial [Planctomycetota bacterium]|nr:alpha/beta fold hydrolase [Planctomycetota bacterium]